MRSILHGIAMRFKTTIFLCLCAVLLFWRFQKTILPSPRPVISSKPETVRITQPVSMQKTRVPVSETLELPDQQLIALLSVQLQKWDDDDDPALREQRLRELAVLLDRTNTLEIVRSLPPAFLGSVFALPSLREKLLADPQATLNWMDQNPNVQSQLLTFLHDWDRKNEDEMLQTVNDLPDGAWKQKVLAAAVNEILSENPATAVALTAQMDSTSPQTMWRDMAMTQWAKKNPDEALQFADKVDDATLRNGLFSDIAVGIANDDPQDAAAFASKAIDNPAVLDQCIGTIVWIWAQRDPVSAGVWVGQLPPGNAQQAALNNLLMVWGNHDADAVTAWIENLPAGTFQIESAQNALSVLFSKDQQ